MDKTTLDIKTKETNVLNLTYLREFSFLSIGIFFNLIFLVIICQNVKTRSLNSRKPMGFLLIGIYLI